MENRDIIYRNILENMSDGVMTIDLEGKVITFNRAAERIFDMKAEDVLDKPFAASFMLLEGSDEFNQTILDAIYESETIHKKIVSLGTGEKSLSLEVTTSFLQETVGEERKRLAVIVVFDDITETERLREAERNLTEELKKNHKELQDAYVKIEATNEDLKTALKKVQVARISATIFVILLFVGIGFYSWNMKGPSGAVEEAAPSGKPGEVQTMTVQPQYVSSSISLTGELKPLNVVNITSPFSGKVKERHFEYGEVVSNGQLLVTMDTYEVAMQLRDAQVSHIKAVETLRSLENWKDSTDVSNAKRSLTRAQMSLETQKQNLEEVKALLEKGIVAQSEYDNAVQQFENQKIDYEAAREALATTLERGSEENLKVARLELENVRQKLRDLEEQLSRAEVRAAVSGTVILPESGEGEDKDVIEKGKSVSQGDILVSVGNMEGFSITANVDEVSVTRIKPGQKVNVTGEAFRDLFLEGRVSHVSSQAKTGAMGGVPTFEIAITLENIAPEQADRLRIGMSTSLELIIYENPEAMLVPINAVKFDENGQKYVEVKDRKTGQLRKAPVETGTTTLDSVEILSGLEAGDEVAL